MQEQGAAHLFVPTLEQRRGRQWRCAVCACHTSSLATVQARGMCPGPVEKLRRLASLDKGHVLWCSTYERADGQPGYLLSCTQCAGWSTERGRMLTQQCPGHQEQRRRVDLQRIRAGRHPKDSEIELSQMIKIADPWRGVVHFD